MIRYSIFTAALLAGTVTLSACGGAGSEVVSTPAPAPMAPEIIDLNSIVVQNQLAPAPAWTTGTYEGIAVVRNNLNGDVAQAPAGTVSLAVDTGAKTYTLTVSAGSVSVAAVPFSMSAGSDDPYDTSPYIGTNVKFVYRWSDGVARPAQDGSRDVTSGGYSRHDTRLPDQKVLSSYLAVSGSPGRHVSLGYWSLSETPLNPDGTWGVTSAWSEGQFVFGNRTAPNDIPISGTARYLLGEPEAEGEVSVSWLAFDVDFAARSITADVSRSLEVDLYPGGITCCYGGEETTPDPATRIGTIALATEASGTAPITSAGTFDIALAGTALVHTTRVDNAPVADIASLVSGLISGAFFGPQASELGGTYILRNLLSPDGTVYSNSGAFTALQSIR